MNTRIISIQTEFQRDLNGRVGLLLYCFLDLCVKAEAEALLSAEFITTDKIEDLADVSIPDNSRFCLIPKDERYIQEIIAGVMQEHPEFKPAIMTVSKDKLIDFDEADESEEHPKLIVFTIPEVNKDRRDVLMQAVDTYYDKCKVDMENTRTQCIAKQTGELIGRSAEEVDEAKKASDKIYDGAVEVRDKLKEEKVKEIEEAYQRYLEKQKEKETLMQEQEAAQGEKAGFSMKMLEEDDNE